MKEAGLVVYDCSSSQKNFSRYITSFCDFLRFKKRSDIIFVGFLGHFLIPLVKLFTRKRIVFDSFVSVYLTMAIDRERFKPSSFLAILARFIDKVSCQLSDNVFAGTYQEINYFVNECGLDKNKFCRLLVGSDDSVMYPREYVDSEDFIVHFHGEFQRLHGVEYIVEAAALLPNVKFQLIGKGRCLNQCKRRAEELNLNNVQFIQPVSYEELPEHISKADVCLGIFGDTAKTTIVIPHKAYESIAMAKPLVTADTPATREIFINEENAMLCERANPESLAMAIRKLRDNKDLRETIAEKGYHLFKERCTPRVLGEEIASNLYAMIKG